MDLDRSKQACGTCSQWTGKRECDDKVCHVSPSAKGSCKKLNKTKVPQGACNDWTEMEGEG